MTTLRMNTDSARACVSTMRNAVGELQNSLSTTTNTSNSMMSEWQGNSATQFQGEFEQWRSAMNQTIQALEALAGRLEAEINEWEAMAANL